MVLVTDKEYYLDKGLKNKIDLMLERTRKSNTDTLLIIDGEEGLGKSNMAVGIGYYVAYEMARPFTLANIFFDGDKMIEFAVKNEEQVIIWDEAVLSGMASEWRTKVQRLLLKMLMIARKKKHFFIFNIPRVFKLNETIIERAIGLVHVYARGQTQIGHFVYFKKDGKETLHDTWRKKKIKNYRKGYSLHGTFPAVLDKSTIISNEAYDVEKDKAIESILKTDKKAPLKSLAEAKAEIGIDMKERDPSLTWTYISEITGIPERTLSDYRKRKGLPMNTQENSRKLAF